MLTDWEYRRQIVTCGKQVYGQGLVAATDGNISVRMLDDRMLITPTGAALGNLNPEELVYLDLTGTVLQGRLQPSSELALHLMIYHRRPDVLAVIHAHPPIATAFSVAGEVLSRLVLPEVIVQFGEIPTAPYATPATTESAQAVQELIQHHDLIVLDHHGAVAVGESLTAARQKMEKLEHTAKILLAADQLGTIRPLSATAILALQQLKK